MLFNQQEIQAILALIKRIPMTPAEALFTQGFFQRLTAFCALPEPVDDSLLETEEIDHGHAETETEDEKAVINENIEEINDG